MTPLLQEEYQSLISAINYDEFQRKHLDNCLRKLRLSVWRYQGAVPTINGESGFPAHLKDLRRHSAWIIAYADRYQVACAAADASFMQAMDARDAPEHDAMEKVK